MYDEWANQDFSSALPLTEAEMAHGAWAIVETERTTSLRDDGVVIDFPTVSAEPPVILWDDFVEFGGKGAIDTGPLSTDIDGDGVDDGTTVDEITVPPGPRTPAYDPPVIPPHDGGGVPPYDPGGGSEGGGDPTSPPETPQVQQSFLDALREFINQNRAREEVGDRNANSRFNRDPSSQTEIRVNSTTVYWDGSTQSFWFDSDGDGSTPETEFWVYGDGVWYDYNNDGSADTRVVEF